MPGQQLTPTNSKNPKRRKKSFQAQPNRLGVLGEAGRGFLEWGAGPGCERGTGVSGGCRGRNQGGCELPPGEGFGVRARGPGAAPKRGPDHAWSLINHAGECMGRKVALEWVAGPVGTSGPGQASCLAQPCPACPPAPRDLRAGAGRPARVGSQSHAPLSLPRPPGLGWGTPGLCPGGLASCSASCPGAWMQVRGEDPRT